MTDTSIADPTPPPYDAQMEALVSRLESDMGDVRSILGQMMPMLVRVESMLTSTLPHLATKSEVADLRVEMHTGLGHMRSEIGSVRGEIGGLRGEVNALRGEMHREIGDLRGEMHREIGELCGEMNREIGKVRVEFGDLRGEVNREIGSVRSEIGSLRADLADKPGKVYLWGVLTAMVAAYAAGLAALAVLK